MAKEKNKNWIARHPVWSGIIGFVLLMAIIGAILPGDESGSASVSTGAVVSTPSVSTTPTTTPTTSNPTTTTIIEEESDIVTIGEKNALSQALSYLRYTSFSYSGLVEQLEFEGYSHTEAVYGVDNCGADWNEQAALKAQSYLDYSAFSREGLIEQLEYEGFTNAQAEYGVEAVGY